jgi:anti-anti-sigma factor
MARVGPVDRLSPGDHACLTFSDPEERFDILAAFVATGAARGDKVICYTDAVGVDDVRGEFTERGVPDERRPVQVERSERLYHEDPVLRICRQHVPPGVRVAGELDYRRADALNDALAETVRLDRDIHLNLNHLRFIDASAAAVILRTAAGLPSSRRMIVVCPEPIERTLTVAGAAAVPNLRMLVRDAER